MRKLAKKIRFGENGQAMVEYAITIPVFLLIVFFIIDFGWISYQKIAFEHGCLRASWYISAEDLGDDDLLEEKYSEKIYAGDELDELLEEYIESSFWGSGVGELSIVDAQAYLYNDEKTSGGKVGEESNYTRYMKLKATVTYEITPLTPLFSMLNIIPDQIKFVKNIECIRVVATSQRTK